MKAEKKNVLDSINKRLASLKDAPSFTISPELLALCAKDPAKAADEIAKAKKAYDEQNTVSPLRIVVQSATIAALANLDSEEEAREVARLAVSQWLTAKGLRSLSAAQLVRAVENKPEDSDIPRHTLQVIARAYMAKDKADSTLKSVTDIVKHFKLADTSRQAFALEQGSLRKLAEMADIPAPTADESTEESAK